MLSPPHPQFQCQIDSYVLIIPINVLYITLQNILPINQSMFMMQTTNKYTTNKGAVYLLSVCSVMSKQTARNVFLISTIHLNVNVQNILYIFFWMHNTSLYDSNAINTLLLSVIT